MRKVVGAGRGQLVRQFLTETLVLTILAVPFSLLLLVVALPLFNELAGTDVGLSWGGNVWMIGTVLAVVVLVGLLAGCYPALFLSRFHPVEVLHGRTSLGSSGAVLRRMLVVFQFTVSIVLIVGTVVVLRQIDYVQHKKLGFDAEQILLIHLTDPLLSQQHEMLKQEFQRLPNVTGATAGWGMPGQRGFYGSSYIDKPFGEDGPPVTLARPPIDSDFLKILDIPLLAGRNISDTVPESGTLEAIVNESAVDALGWRGPGDALGKEFGGVTVVGVVADFHFRSLHEEIEPLMMTQNQFGRAGVVALRVSGGDVAGSLRALEKEWKATGTSIPFEFSFLTDELDLLYEREQRTAKFFGIFAGLAILIAILGLIGLAAFSAARRTKEIGIRKVLGAGVLSIIGLLTREFLWVVAAAFIIAAPVAYVAAQRWLETFAYRVELSWPLFVGGGLAALVFALTAVCSQAVRAALADPVNSLRYE